MPSNYAHYRFSRLAEERLPEPMKKTVRRFHRLYEVGHHGPDLFFHYNVFFHTAVGALGSGLHRQTGKVFFTRVCKRVRQDPSEAALSYLWGLLGHYCLDSVCHPLIHQHTDEGDMGHVELETEFDRYLMELDGHSPAWTQDFSAHMKLRRGEAMTAAVFFPPCKWLHLYQASRNMALHTHLLAKAPRKLVEKVVGAAGPNIAQQLMPMEENKHCSRLDGPLLALFDEAMEKYPAMLLELQEHLEKGTPLGEDFAPDFG